MKQTIQMTLLFLVVILDGLATLALGALSVLGVFIGFLFIVFNVGGLLFGFEDSSGTCSDLRNGRLTRLQLVGFPVAPYACKPDGGLLQPATKDTLRWFNEVPK